MEDSLGALLRAQHGTTAWHSAQWDPCQHCQRRWRNPSPSVVAALPAATPAGVQPLPTDLQAVLVECGVLGGRVPQLVVQLGHQRQAQLAQHDLAAGR